VLSLKKGEEQIQINVRPATSAFSPFVNAELVSTAFGSGNVDSKKLSKLSVCEHRANISDRVIQACVTLHGSEYLGAVHDDTRRHFR